MHSRKSQGISWWHFLQTRTHSLIVGLAFLVVLTACQGANTGSSSPASSARGGSQPTATSTTSAVPDPLPTVAPTVGLNTLDGPLATGGKATLGGTVDAFVAAYGSPTIRNTSLVGFQTHCSNGRSDCIQTALFPGADTTYYVDLVTMSTPDSQRWSSLQAAKDACHILFPADARLVSQQEDIQSGVNQGWYAMYHSDTLARIFSADAFLDGNGNPSPGSFDILYLGPP